MSPLFVSLTFLTLSFPPPLFPPDAAPRGAPPPSSEAPPALSGISLKLHSSNNLWHFNINVNLCTPGSSQVHPSFKPELLVSTLR